MIVNALFFFDLFSFFQDETITEKKAPTHHSELDPKTMNVSRSLKYLDKKLSISLFI